MRPLIITQNATVDGSIEMLDSWFDPQRQDDELTAELHRQDATSDALLVGRRTFEDFRGYWPDRHDDTTGVSAYLDQVRKYVVSTTLGDPGWANTTVLADDPVAQVEALKAEPGQDIVCTGSISLCHTLIAANLVDEYRMFVYPVVQGRGRRLFPEGFTTAGLEPAAAPRTFPSGVTLVRWRQVR